MTTTTPDPIPAPENREFYAALARIIAHSANVQLTEIKVLEEGPPPDRLNPIVICVVRDEIERLPYFLKHYRLLGVLRFVFIDNNSKDGTSEYLATQPDADVFGIDEPFSWQLKQGWINSVIERYGRHRWYVYVDADEHLVFDGSEERQLLELVGYARSLKLSRVRGQLVDMYPGARSSELGDGPSGDPLSSAPYFDGTGYQEFPLPSRVSKRGGPRKRLLHGENGLDPELTKYPLFYAGDIDVFANPHYIWPFPPNFASPCLIGLLHFKFDAGLPEKIKKAIKEENYWNNSYEYKAYDRLLQGDTSLVFDGSREFRHSKNLVEAGLIAPVAWPAEIWAASEATVPSLRNLRGNNGKYRLRKGARDFSYATPPIPVRGGENLIVTAAVSGSLGTHEASIHVLDDGGNECGPPHRTSSGVFAEFGAPASASSLRIVIDGLAIDQGTLEISLLKIARRPPRAVADRKVPVIASLASIPSRRDLLEDAVFSLVAQVDKLRVYLNGYEDVPGFLLHPKIEVRRSEDWDDNGDAGKIAWLTEDADGAYVILADDDLIYPSDLVVRLKGHLATYDDRAIVGLHGVVLRQPVGNYYSQSSRHTVHYSSPVKMNYPVHLLGTGCVMFNSGVFRLSKTAALYPNMADVWIALDAKRQGIPLYCVDRPYLWVRENKRAEGRPSIWSSSSRRTLSPFDTSKIQTYVIEQSYPWLMPIAQRPRWAFIVHSPSIDTIVEAIEQLIAMPPSTDRHWVVLLVALAPTLEDRVRSELNKRNIVLEVFFPREFASLATVAEQYSLEGLLISTGRLRLQSEWDRSLYAGDMAVISDDRRGASVYLWRKTAPDIRAAFGTKSGAASFRRDFAEAQGEREKKHRSLLFGRGPLSAAAQSTPVSETSGVNDLFEDIVVLNLRRRPDRWERMKRRLKAIGVRARRVDAIDARAPEIMKRYGAYSGTRLRRIADSLELRSMKDFYLGYLSQAARAAYLEGKTLSKAIGSAGAFAHLLSWEMVLNDAVSNGVSSILILEDDCIFHKEFSGIFAQAVNELPDDWQIFQLGTMQFDWSEPWITPFSPHLYRSNGSSIGSHAVGLRSDAIVKLLAEIRRFLLPTDIGPLSAAVRTFKDRNFIVMPNLAIQEAGESDISQSGFQAKASRAEVCETFRWRDEDYG